MASGLILGILFMRYQKWYLAAVAAGILFGIVWNLWHNTIRNCSEKDSMANARAWIYPVFRVGCFLAFFLAGIFHFAENEAFRQNYMSKLQDEKPLTDVNGKMVGTMYAESFVENPGEQINTIQNTNLTLYFSNQAGDGLVKETRRVHYSSNISLEKLIMEQLLEGPESKNARSAIPSETKLMSVSLVDGVCYVSFDENFKNQDYSVNEAIVIYSIVDSLSELSSISKVQISVNGDTSGVYRDSFKLADMYDRNLDYIAKTAKTDTEVVEETETEEQ
jgi:hypothetical protein